MADSPDMSVMLEILKQIQRDVGYLRQDVSTNTADIRGIKEHLATMMRGEVIGTPTSRR